MSAAAGEAALGGRGQDLGGEHAPHLPPLVSEWGDAGAAVPEAEGLSGEGGRVVGKDSVFRPRSTSRAAAGHDTATTCMGPEGHTTASHTRSS